MADPQPTTNPNVVQVTTEDVEDPNTNVAGPPPSAPSPGPETQAPPPKNGQALTSKPKHLPEPGIGLEGEFTVWEGRYSYKNFIGRLFFRVVASIAWFALAYWAWGRTDESSQSLRILATIVGVVVLLYWLHLLWQVFYARNSHFYRLTNKRLFVWTGVFQRRTDQLELVKVNDVYTRSPSILARMLNIGTVVIESQEEKLPMTYLTGVDMPEQVMDTVWHTSRAERDGHTVRIDQV